MTTPKKATKKDEKDRQKVNFEQLIWKNLADFGTSDYSNYHYTSLNLSSKGLEGLSPIFVNFKSIEKINLSGNLITDPSQLALMPSLSELDLSRNSIKELKFLQVQEGWKSLRKINLSNNKISELSPVPAPSLIQLILSENKIQKVDGFGGHPKLKILDLCKNKITALAGIANLPELNELYLTENKIKSLAGLDGMPQLNRLHLRKNVIMVFDQTFPTFESLNYLNLRENLIEKFGQILKVKELPQLRTLIYSFTPLITNYEFYLFDTINAMVRLERINKVAVSRGVKLRAFNHAEAKYRREQEAKKKAEEEERLRLEAEQNKEQPPAD